ncbi:lysylphosphatidylglycerol synthase transmembrane domain-containing protein [uncultured Jannaschia sp.]|uniref:lysylphosphatidylglycerol synthase transmembrane domain-containing protein n=1 Tax=uncultured Jannaschia sp. TaxID=293347 RepID=UPI0026127F66|nr:lysylphosphatidylglycerol synthase transmembrane domain-containing protein [uncultured Jannaschia sp.]
MRGRRAALSRLAFSFGLVALILWWIDAAGAVARLRQAEGGWLLLAALLLTVQTVLMALRWRLTAAQLGLAIPRRRAVGEYYLAQAVNMTLPGGVLGDAARAVRSRAEAGFGTAALAVMIERLAGQAAMFAVATAGFGLALLRPGGIGWPAGTGAILLAAVALAILLPLLARRLPVSATFARAVRTALLARAVWPRQAALALVVVALNLAACARATGTRLGPEAATTLVPLVLTAMLVPVSVAGWGWREGAAALLFPLAGATAAAGVAASLAFGAIALAASLPGLLWPVLSGWIERDLPQRETGR